MGLGLELPVACSTLAGNAHEGKHYIINREQILEHHGKTSKIDLADAKYDEHDNFAFSRSHGAIPIIDYNPRSEKGTAAALKERGYDRNGWPYICAVWSDDTSQLIRFRLSKSKFQLPKAVCKFKRF